MRTCVFAMLKTVHVTLEGGLYECSVKVKIDVVKLPIIFIFLKISVKSK